MRYATALASTDRARAAGSSYAVMNMTGHRGCVAVSLSYSSKPVMPGRCTSRTRHAVSAGSGASSNASAEGNITASNPAAFKHQFHRPTHVCIVLDNYHQGLSRRHRFTSTAALPAMSGTRHGGYSDQPRARAIGPWGSFLPLRAAGSKSPALVARPGHQEASDLSLDGRKFEQASHLHQLGQRLRLHLLHDMGALHFDGTFRGPKLGRNLLVEQAGHDPSVHV